MDTDYSMALAALALISLVLTTMTVYVLSRPSDLAPRA